MPAQDTNAPCDVSGLHGSLLHRRVCVNLRLRLPSLGGRPPRRGRKMRRGIYMRRPVGFAITVEGERHKRSGLLEV